jgi:ribonucleoside-diphosphate reductase beta chain
MDPDLAARLVLMSLPVAARRIPGDLTYELTVDGWGTYRISTRHGSASVEQLSEAQLRDMDLSDPSVDFRIQMDARTLAQMAAGASPGRLMLEGRLRIRGKRRRALKLRAMADGELDLAEVLRGGAEIEPDLLYRALEYLIDPDWTKGHGFTVVYEIEGAGAWQVEVRDGNRVSVATGRPSRNPDATVRLSRETFRHLLTGELTPTNALQTGLTAIEGQIYPVTLLGRWMERAQGRDDKEMAREREQRAKQSTRIGSWGGLRPANANGSAPQRPSGELMDYGELYALWERQNWKAHELDFSVDREQWVTTPRDAQLHMTWSLGSFYIGEERVTADLVPFVSAAPSGEVEAFLTTQLVDEARHAVFFDRFGAEVMVLEADDLRGRLREIESIMLDPWRTVFDDELRGISRRIQQSPDDLDLFVEGIVTYHMVIEGVLAMTGQNFILRYLESHGLYPGFQKGFSLVERDEHRHIAFGVRFLKEIVASDPGRYGDMIERRVAELVPRAAGVFQPPYAESPSDFFSYGYHSSEIYGYAYRALKRRMGVVGLQVPPASELFPGPIDSDAPAPVEATAIA